jgi:hypothetical protein
MKSRENVSTLMLHIIHHVERLAVCILWLVLTMKSQQQVAPPSAVTGK